MNDEHVMDYAKSCITELRDFKVWQVLMLVCSLDMVSLSYFDSILVFH